MKKERLKRIFYRWNDFVAFWSYLTFITLLMLIFFGDVYLLRDATSRVTIIEIIVGIIGAITVSVGFAWLVFTMLSVDKNE